MIMYFLCQTKQHVVVKKVAARIYSIAESHLHKVNGKN